MQYKESPVMCGISVYPLKKLGFNMVHYILFIVNQAINDKRSVIKIFSRSIQMFILATVIANEQYTNHLKKKCKLKMLCYKTKKCKSYLWPLLLLQPSYPSCKYNN